MYEVILAHELRQRGLCVEQQVPISIEFRSIKFNEVFRADIVVESKVVLELKSVGQISSAHKKQLQTYLRLTGYKLGFLLNFGEALMKNGITRAVNGLDERARRLFSRKVRKGRQEKSFKIRDLGACLRFCSGMLARYRKSDQKIISRKPQSGQRKLDLRTWRSWRLGAMNPPTPSPSRSSW